MTLGDNDGEQALDFIAYVVASLFFALVCIEYAALVL